MTDKIKVWQKMNSEHLMMMIADNQIIPMKIIIKLRIMGITHEVFT
jgi:hypothetical protein